MSNEEKSDRLAEIVLELRKLAANTTEENDNIMAAIAYLDCARWNIGNEISIYKVSQQVITKVKE